MPEFSFKNNAHKPTAQSAALIDVRGNWDGHSVNWDAERPGTSLTTTELLALKSKHGTPNFNTQRAESVKALMMQGKKQVEIVRALKPLGHGYGERMIKADHAALSEAAKKQAKKVQ